AVNFPLFSEASGPRTICLRPGSSSARQMDRERGPPLGPLSAAREPECRKPAFGGRPIFPVTQLGLACVLRSGVSDASTREHPPVEFFRSCRAQSKCPAAAGTAFSRQLLRDWLHEGIPWRVQAGCQLFSPLRQRLRRRRPVAEHRGQLSDLISQGRYLRRRGGNRYPSLGQAIG